MITSSSLAAITLAILMTIAYRGHGITTALLTIALLCLLSAVLTWFGPLTWLLTALFFICFPFAIPILRQKLFTESIRSVIRRSIQPLSTTEKEAINADSVWWEGELFGGQPDWLKLLSGFKPDLSDEEQDFIEGPVTELCHILDNWHIKQNSNRLTQLIVNYVCNQGFLGINIPKRYGGLEFSPFAQSEILLRLNSSGSSVNFLLNPTNSFGLSELIINYGNETQKEYYLPRFASGQEIPCFVLTRQIVGSDATSIPDIGTVSMGEWQGDEVIGVRLNFCQRNIMFSPIATLFGLAFKLKDPDKLIGNVIDYGITCALIPRDTKGIEFERRHRPVDDTFLNGPIQGKDVFIPLSFIIGGPELAGKGWRMLMGCLTVQHFITLTTTAVATSKHSLLCSSTYARQHRQFGVSLRQFKCTQKLLARIAGLTYIIDATRLQTIQAIMEGNKPSVLMEILNYYTPEMAKQCVIDAIDIQTGKALIKSSKDYMADMYDSVPVVMTAEGSNFLARNPMFFGQGTTLSHPFVMLEITLSHAEDKREVITEFDNILTAHIGNMISNFSRMLLMGIGLSREAAPTKKQHLLPYYRHFNRLSSLFAVITDITLLNLNAKLKFKEIFSARLGDLLSLLFLGSLVIKQHEESQQSDEEWPVAQWALDYLLYQYQTAFDQLMENWPNRFIPILLKHLAFPSGGRFSAPKDKLEKSIVELITLDSATRTNLTGGFNMGDRPNNSLAEVNRVFLESLNLQPIMKKVNCALHSGDLTIPADGNFTNTALDAELISEYKAEQL